jgi:uncharacterized protein (DUF934 family)
MQNLINETSVLENKWQLITDLEADLTQANIMIPAQLWLDNKEALAERKDVSIWLAGDSDLSAFENLDNFEAIGINFPAFADGRGYSLARLVSERLNFKGEIRAIGDVLIDQLFFMKRCGFTSYLLKEGLDADKALNYFSTFTDPYQLAADIKEPLFRRKA